VGRDTGIGFLPTAGLAFLAPGQAFAAGTDASGNSSFALLNSDGTTIPLAPPLDFPNQAAFVECGEVWLASSSSKVGQWISSESVFGINPGFDHPSRRSPNCVSLDGDPLGDFEIYLEHGTDIYRYASTGTTPSVTALHFHPGGEDPPGARCGVAWVAHGEAFAFSDEPASVIHVVDGSTNADSKERVLPVGAADRIRSLAQTHSLGTLVGTDGGHVYRRARADASWSVAVSAPPDLPVDWITELPQGILLASRDGRVMMIEEGAACAVVDTGGTIDARPVPQGNGVLVVGRTRGPGDVRGTARWLVSP
jgi:hypothetical protein